MQTPPTLLVYLAEPSRIDFGSLFGAGVQVEATVGLSLLAFLCDQLSIDRTYVDQRIQTIFLNGRAVDRVDQVTVGPGDVIALSAAMPGLAGATLRKSGHFAALRKEISHDPALPRAKDQRKAMVTLKLFNLVAKELAPPLLARGIWARGDAIAAHLRQYGSAARPVFEKIVYNERALSLDDLSRLCGSEDMVFFKTAAGKRPPLSSAGAAD